MSAPDQNSGTHRTGTHRTVTGPAPDTEAGPFPPTRKTDMTAETPMTRLPYPKVLNFLVYQGIWFTAILGREPWTWLLAGLLALHLALSRDRRGEAAVMMLCAGMGITLDSVLSVSGVFVFDPAPEVLAIPLWLAGLWLGFAGALRNSLRYLLTRPRLASVAAGISAPLSYFAGMRMGAVTFGVEDWLAGVIIGGAWACLMPVFLAVARKADKKADRYETGTETGAETGTAVPAPSAP